MGGRLDGEGDKRVAHVEASVGKFEIRPGGACFVKLCISGYLVKNMSMLKTIANEMHNQQIDSDDHTSARQRVGTHHHDLSPPFAAPGSSSGKSTAHQGAIRMVIRSQRRYDDTHLGGQIVGRYRSSTRRSYTIQKLVME